MNALDSDGNGVSCGQGTDLGDPAEATAQHRVARLDKSSRVRRVREVTLQQVHEIARLDKSF